MMTAFVVVVTIASGPADAVVSYGSASPAARRTVERPLLEDSLDCGGTSAAALDPVLLVHGATVEPEENFGWNYVPAFEADGRWFCTVALPARGNDDIQVAAEYVVHAIRWMNDQAGRRVDVVGWSEGGMIGRWATRFYPDTRHMVDDIVGIAPTNHGINPALCISACPQAFWQMRTGSMFLTALNRRAETLPGISYTNIASHFDQIVPAVDGGTLSWLNTGPGEITNVLVQDLCPLDVADHYVLGTVDPVAYALAVDAMDHAGPAKIERVASDVCDQVVHPGVDESTFATDLAALVAASGASYASHPRTTSEPPLRRFAKRGPS